MAKKGPNSKAEAGNAKKAASKAEKDSKKAAAAEAAEASKWAQGAKGKNNKKEDAEAKKVFKSYLLISKSDFTHSGLHRLLLLPKRLRPLNFW